MPVCSLPLLQDDDHDSGKAPDSPSGSTNGVSQQSTAGCSSTDADLAYSTNEHSPEDSADEDGLKNERVHPIIEEVGAEPSELVVGHRVGYVRKSIDGGELVIGVSMGLITKVIDGGELAIGALHISK